MTDNRYERREVYESSRGETLAIVFYKGERTHPVHGRMALTNDCEIMQAARICNDHHSDPNLDRPMVFDAHWHKPQVRTIVGTAEAWIVLAGGVRVLVYDTLNNYVGVVDLHLGDMFLSLAGGHSYEMAPGSEVLELKTGPYNGREADKELI